MCGGGALGNGSLLTAQILEEWWQVDTNLGISGGLNSCGDPSLFFSLNADWGYLISLALRGIPALGHMQIDEEGKGEVLASLISLAANLLTMCRY